MTPQDQLDIRDLALIIARSHDLPLDYVVCADEVSENDDEFLTAICASADVQDIVDGFK